jgi:biopolymer transport protein TolQ
MNPNPLSHTTPPGAWALIADAGAFVKLILVLLLAASVVTWAIIVLKARLLKSARAQNAGFTGLFRGSPSLDEIHDKLELFPDSPAAKVFKAGYLELRKLSAKDSSPDGSAEIANITRALNRAHGIEVEELEKHLDWLASTASAAPFIGLLGTVWGIMESFQNIGAMGSASLAVVAPGISEALISTAIGLAAAIPAAIAYNALVGRTRKISLEIENFSQEFLNLVQRSLLSSKKGGAPHASGTQPLA